MTSLDDLTRDYRVPFLQYLPLNQRRLAGLWCFPDRQVHQPAHQRQVLRPERAESQQVKFLQALDFRLQDRGR